MPIVVSLRPDDYDHTPFEESDRRDPNFPIVLPRVREFVLRSLEHLLRIGEIEAALLQRLVALGRIVADRD